MTTSESQDGPHGTTSRGEDGPPAEGLARIGARSLGILAVRGGGVAATFGLQVLLARVLGVDDFGIYTYVFALLSLGLFPSKWGWDLAAVRYLPAMEPTHDKGRAFVRLAIGRSLLNGALVAAAWILLDLAFGIDELADRPSMLLIVGVTLPFFSLLRVAEGCLRGANRVLVAYVPFTVVWPLAFVAAVLVFEPWHDQEVTRIFALQLVTMALVALGSTGVLWRSVRGDEPASRDERRGWKRTARNLALTSGVVYVLEQISMVVLGIFGGSELTGTYAAAWRLSLLAAGFLVAFNFAFGPVASKLLAQGRKEDLQALLNRTTVMLVAVSLVVFVVGLVAAPRLISVFGEGFEGAVTPLRILLIGQCFNAVCGPVTLLLNVSGHERKTLVLLAPALVVTVTGSAVFASLGSIVGVAATSMVVTVLLNVGLVVQVHRYLGLRTISALLPRHRH